MKFGEKLKKYRIEKRMTQEEVAKAVGISGRAYASYETKNVRPRKRETYERLAKVLNCEMNDLLIEDNASPSPMFYTGVGLIGMGSVLLGPAGVFTAAALGPLAYYLHKHGGKDTTLEEWFKSQNELALHHDKKLKQFRVASLGIILTELGKKGIKCKVGEVKDVATDGVAPDDCIIIDDQSIDEWWFVMWCAESKEFEQYQMFNTDRIYLLVNRFTLAAPSRKRKASIVINDEELFEEICDRKNRISYRGYLSVVLVDMENTRITKEVLLSGYEDSEKDDIFPITKEER